jgi:hypothetical protein
VHCKNQSVTSTPKFNTHTKWGKSVSTEQINFGVQVTQVFLQCIALKEVY